MRKYDDAIAYATRLGKEHGENAATWVEIPDDDSARRILRGIEDGDPEILDQLPYADLSGEWADTLTGPQLVTDAMSEAGYDDEDGDSDVYSDIFGEICDAYGMAFSDASEAIIVERCRYYLSHE